MRAHTRYTRTLCGKLPATTPGGCQAATCRASSGPHMRETRKRRFGDSGRHARRACRPCKSVVLGVGGGPPFLPIYHPGGNRREG
jgi:hypothetical protein